METIKVENTLKFKHFFKICCYAKEWKRDRKRERKRER